MTEFDRLRSGATIAVNVVVKVIEHNSGVSTPPAQLPKPLALLLNYAALDFNFTSWMSPAHLRVLRTEQSSGNLSGLSGLAAQKDHLQHVSPLSMVGDKPLHGRGKRLRRRKSWRDTLREFTSGNEDDGPPIMKRSLTSAGTGQIQGRPAFERRGVSHFVLRNGEDRGDLADAESEEDEENIAQIREEDRPLEARVRYVYEPTSRTNGCGEPEKPEDATEPRGAEPIGTTREEKGKEPIGTRLTMTSRTGYFQDRIISPSMVSGLVDAVHTGCLHDDRCERWQSFTLDLTETRTLLQIITFRRSWHQQAY